MSKGDIPTSVHDNPCRVYEKAPQVSDLRGFSRREFLTVFLERNIVIHLIKPAASRRIRTARATAAATTTRGTTTRSSPTTTATGTTTTLRRLTAITTLIPAAAHRPPAAAKHLHLLGHDLGGIPIRPILRLPLTCANAPFDINRRALLQILVHDLGQPPKKRNPMPKVHPDFKCLLCKPRNEAFVKYSYWKSVFDEEKAKHHHPDI
jgi:hypothetical protein